MPQSRPTYDAVMLILIITTYSTVGKFFNTSSMTGGHVKNIAGDHMVYGLDEKQLGQLPMFLDDLIDILMS